MLRQRQPRQHDEAHLRFIRSLPCVACEDNTATEAAHLKMPCAKAAKRNVGIGEKADDKWTLPLCGEHHREQHKLGEELFWRQYGIDPVSTASFLFGVSGNYEMGEAIVRAAQS